VTAAELLARLHEVGVEARAEGDELRLRGRQDALTPVLRDAVRRWRAELLQLLRRRRLREAGRAEAWPRLSLAAGVCLVAGEEAWAAFCHAADEHQVRLALAALGLGAAPPQGTLRRWRLAAGGAIACPRCGNPAYSRPAQGPPWRRCDGSLGCGQTWTPEAT
jgi:TubC N-terminal docking domain